MADGIPTDRPESPLDREEIAKIEVGQTTISSVLARVMTVAFLVAIAVLPIIELSRADALDTPAASGSANAATDAEADVTGVSSAPGVWEAWQHVVAVNRQMLARMVAFETALEDQSAIGQALRPPTQLVLSGLLGAGNERVYVGDDGWLFFRADVEYITGRGFLDPFQHERRIASASEYEQPPQPDPRTAILQFKRDLARRGVTLVLVPTPVKPTVHPEQLASNLQAHRAIVQNASYQTFLADLREHGVLVFDAAEALARMPPGHGARYLSTDTHWRPDSMQRVAEQLAAFMLEHVGLPSVPSPGYAAERREARQTGDTTAMLDLPAGQTLYPPERVALRFIVQRDGNPWRPSRDADVLLLGDSFTNIYSLPTMGWGESAGFAEQLSYVLARPLDRIVQNDQGAYATRGLLAREPARLQGKRVVIWQFAARELAFGDWRLIDLP